MPKPHSDDKYVIHIEFQTQEDTKRLLDAIVNVIYQLQPRPICTLSAVLKTEHYARFIFDAGPGRACWWMVRRRRRDMSDDKYVIHIECETLEDRTRLLDAIEGLIHQMWQCPPVTVSASTRADESAF